MPRSGRRHPSSNRWANTKHGDVDRSGEVVEHGDGRRVRGDKNDRRIKAFQIKEGTSQQRQEFGATLRPIGKARAISEVNDVLPGKKALYCGDSRVAANSRIEHGNRFRQARKVIDIHFHRVTRRRIDFYNATTLKAPFHYLSGRPQ